jgi:hypothetical protein
VKPVDLEALHSWLVGSRPGGRLQPPSAPSRF